MTDYGHHFKKKSPVNTIPATPDQMYPQSKFERKKIIETASQRRREAYRKFFENLRSEYLTDSCLEDY